MAHRLFRHVRGHSVAYLALFFALGGTSFAAVQTLPANSVGARQLKKNAVINAKIKNDTVTGAKVKNDSLTGTDILESSLGKVPSAANTDNATHASNADTATNATNAANATNASHAATADTVTGQGTLASGHTEVGIIGGRFQNGANANSPMAISTTFTLMAPVALSNSDIEVAPSTHCTGSTANPSAAAGFVCIYPDILVFANTVSGNTGVAGDTKLGFQMEWNATTANSQSSVRAEWAYTAP
jgi:hypothetical protein